MGYTEFRQHPAIQRIADLPIWTTNNVNPNVKSFSKDPLKIPLDAHMLVTTGQIKFLSNKVDYNPYVTLDTLANLPSRYNTRVLRADVQATHYLFIDVEPKVIKDHAEGYNLEIYNAIKTHALADYAEYSSHGGVHLMVYIPDRLLNDPQYQPIFRATAIKYPEKTLEVFANGSHRITLTENVIKTPVFKHDDPEFLKHISALLDYFLAQAQTNMTMHARGNIQKITKDDLSDFELNLLKYVHKRMQIGNILNRADKLATSDASKKEQGDYDPSLAEWSIICSCLIQVNRCYQKLLKTPLRSAIIPDFKDDLTANEFCQIAYTLAKQIMLDDNRERTKWYTDRDGMEYLLYLTVNAYSQYHQNEYDYGELK